MGMSNTEVKDSLTLFRLDSKRLISVQKLKELLPDVQTAAWFGAYYKLSRTKLAELFIILFDSPVLKALMTEGYKHSTSLQTYLAQTLSQAEYSELQMQKVVQPEAPAPDLILPQLWEAAEVKVATVLREVADTITDVVDRLPSKNGKMVFRTLAKMNANRPTVGVYEPHISHHRRASSLLILDVSGSMTEETIRTIAADVVGLAWKADAHLAVVSDTMTVWEPGGYDVKAILRAAEFRGTHYEQLAPLFNQNWGTVITVADYDSSWSAKEVLQGCSGTIEEIIDISLVDRPTFLSASLGHMAKKITPMIVGSGHYPLSV